MSVHFFAKRQEVGDRSSFHLLGPENQLWDDTLLSGRTKPSDPARALVLSAYARGAFGSLASRFVGRQDFRDGDGMRK